LTVRATRVRRLRIRKAIRRTTYAAALVAAGTLYLAVQKHVTLVVEGRPHVVRTLGGSVEQILHSEGIPWTQVAPPPGTPVVDGMTVLVDLGGSAGLPVAPKAVPGEEGVWVVAGASDPLARAEFLGDSTFAGGVGSSRVVPVGVVVTGKERDVLTNARTVRELLSAMGIQPDDDDHVSPPPSTQLRSGVEVRFERVRFHFRKVRIHIPFTTSTEYTGELPSGEVRIVRDGSPGIVVRVYRARVVDGERVGRVLVSRHVAIAPVSRHRLVGRAQPEPVAEGDVGHQVGEASWYHAPGDGMTAAHPWLPFGTVVKVTNLDNGTTVTVRINDRGPFGGRIIDLNEEAFAQIAPLGQGVADVRLSW